MHAQQADESNVSSSASSSSLAQIIGDLKTSLANKVDTHEHDSPKPSAHDAAVHVPAAGKCIEWTDFEADPPCMRRQTPAGKEEVGILSKGPEGCAIVTWPDGEQITDVSNLLLVKKLTMKKPAAAASEVSVLKKPAAAAAEGEPMLKKPAGHFPVRRKPAAAEIDPVAARVGGDIVLEHDVLYYKKGHRIGIREKPGFGDGLKRQIFSFGGTACGASVDQLRSIGIMCCKKLAEGWSPEGTKAWAVSSLESV